MRDLRKGIRDYLMLRRGLGFKLVTKPDWNSSRPSWNGNVVLILRANSHWSGQHCLHITSPACGPRA
jgi:hypothetical protein